VFAKRGDGSVCVEHHDGSWNVRHVSDKGSAQALARVIGYCLLEDCASRVWSVLDMKCYVDQPVTIVSGADAVRQVTPAPPPALATTCSCNHLLLQPPDLATTCSCNHLLLQPPALATTCSCNHLLLQPPALATTSSCNHLLFTCSCNHLLLQPFLCLILYCAGCRIFCSGRACCRRGQCSRCPRAHRLHRRKL
jgi:hypothetical protein